MSIIDEPDQVEVERLVEDWGISEDIAALMVATSSDTEVDMNMVIMQDGMVLPATDEEDLKAIILELMMGEGGLNNVAYIFLDGEAKSVAADIEFIDTEDNDVDEDNGLTAGITEEEYRELLTNG